MFRETDYFLHALTCPLSWSERVWHGVPIVRNLRFVAATQEGEQ